LLVCYLAKFAMSIVKTYYVSGQFRISSVMTVSQEMSKDVPSLPSSQYGKRLANIYDPPGRQYVRVAYVETDFYRRNGTNLCDDGVKVLPR